MIVTTIAMTMHTYIIIILSCSRAQRRVSASFGYNENRFKSQAKQNFPGMSNFFPSIWPCVLHRENSGNLPLFYSAWYYCTCHYYHQKLFFVQIGWLFPVLEKQGFLGFSDLDACWCIPLNGCQPLNSCKIGSLLYKIRFQACYSNTSQIPIIMNLL